MVGGGTSAPSLGEGAIIVSRLGSYTNSHPALNG